MKKLHVVFSFIHLSIPDKIAMGRNVIAEMKNNPSFPNPDVSMENLIVLIDALEVCYLNSRNGGKEQTVLLHQAEAA